MGTTNHPDHAAQAAVAAATVADLAELTGLEAACALRPWTQESIAAELADEHAFHFLLRTTEGRVCSFVLARLIIDELHIHKTGTHPDFRMRGHAKYLIGHVLTKAKERGGKRSLLEVLSENTAAIRLYASLGFTIDTVRKKYYASGEDALLMSRAL